MKRRFAAYLLLLLVTLLGAATWADNGAPANALELQGKINVENVRLWAVQQGGRLKPFDTFAQESVRLVTGQVEFQGADPVDTCLFWWAHGSETANPPIQDLQVIELRNLEFKKELGLDAAQRWFSLKELADKPALGQYQEELAKLPPGAKVPQKLANASELLTKMMYLKYISSGQLLTMVPNASKIDEPWSPITELKGEKTASSELVEKVRKAVFDGDGATFASSTEELGKIMQSMGPYPSFSDLARETHYNHFHPFRKAWILYLFSLICLAFAGGSPVKGAERTTTNTQNSLYWMGVAAAAFGFALHAYGFYLRCSIAGRPPVTNMYESVIWVAFAAVLFSLIFEFVYRARSYLMASTAVAVICLILADTLPTVLDPSIRPLTPVLRNNFWLTIHVLTITAGYAAFLLSLGLGHMVLWKYVFGSDQKETLRGLNKALYKALQVGVLLLAAGTLLGGVWANYSWGRFWGWDPKEVWALIALLGYLAILHGRYAGWLGNFGTAAASVLAYQGVLMAWYGVNFVLGAGLHSYGFGNGGVQYVAVFSFIEVCLVVGAIMHQRKAANRVLERGSED